MNDWYADLGATQDMTDQLEMLVNYEVYGNQVFKVAGIGNTQLNVLGEGDVKFSSTIGGSHVTGVLKGVLYVPGLGTNLFSIAAATNEGYEAHFKEEKVILSRSGVVKLVGQRAGKTLYHLDMNVVVTNQPLEVVIPVHRAVSLSIWHKRFAHANSNTIKKMLAQQLVSGLELVNEIGSHSELCSGCAAGKMHRSSFQEGRRRANAIGELIHSDVCGPMEVATPS